MTRESDMRRVLTVAFVQTDYVSLALGMERVLRAAGFCTTDVRPAMVWHANLCGQWHVHVDVSSHYVSVAQFAKVLASLEPLLIDVRRVDADYCRSWLSSFEEED